MRAVAVLASALLIASCSSDADVVSTSSSSSTSSPSSTPTSAPPTRVVLTKVVEVDQPVALAVRRGEAGFYLAEKTGRVRRVVDGRVVGDPVLDLSARVSTGYEQGLLGLAWSPDGRFLYVNHTDRDGHTRVVEYEGGSGAGREVLFVRQPYANHNGGHLAFTADGRLWIGLGDGGSGGDPQGNAQNLGVLLGKMLRIEPRPSGSNAYGVPADNPFVGRAGARPEIWAYGLRNPWRYSFDRRTGDLWVADVGQGAWEEIDMVPAASKGGENYGWPRREGAHPYKGGTPPPGNVDPVHEYALGDGNCAVVGGYVYRGTRVAALLEGRYLFADSCKGDLMAFSEGKMTSLGLHVEQVSSFGEDADGEVYVLSLEDGVFRLDAA